MTHKHKQYPLQHLADDCVSLHNKRCNHCSLVESERKEKRISTACQIRTDSQKPAGFLRRAFVFVCWSETFVLIVGSWS